MASPSAYKADDSNYKLSQKAKDKIKKLMNELPDEKSVIIPALHAAQDEFGWLPDSVIRELADMVGVAPNKIYGVATFYTMFNLEPVGKYHIQMCRNVSCQLSGAENILNHLSKKLNIKPGETTSDKKYSLTLVECLGSCGSSPVMMINDKYYENLTEKKVDEILKSLPIKEL